MTLEETTPKTAIGQVAIGQVATARAGRRRRSTPDPRHLGRAMAWLARQVELGAADAELSLPQYRVLGILDPGPAISSALADRLAVRRPSVTAVVDGLVARGLVSRRHDECDRRQVSHVLTTEGRRVLAAADRAVDRRLEAVAACLPDPEL
ncbi:MAG TPA: MarR family transcriptional regulator, partial [Acidimicrobiales bacterium]|nr:MarR family transcriptional regulator [Acidimicrobiales bacterium]